MGCEERNQRGYQGNYLGVLRDMGWAVVPEQDLRKWMIKRVGELQRELLGVRGIVQGTNGLI